MTNCRSKGPNNLLPPRLAHATTSSKAVQTEISIDMTTVFDKDVSVCSEIETGGTQEVRARYFLRGHFPLRLGARTA